MRKFPLKRLNDILHDFVAKRGRMVRFILAVATVVLLSSTLCALILIQVTSDYPISSTTPSSVTLEQPTSNTTTSSVTLDQQTSSTTTDTGSLLTIGIGAYWDGNSIDRVNGINWGILEPGAQKSVVIYFRNEGNSTVTLSKSTSNWNPTVAATYMTLSWDYNGQTIEADKNLQVTLTLSVGESITGVTDFGFDITIVGTG